MIWEAVVWVFWNARNDCIFNNVNARWEEVVEEVKVLTWRWMLSRSNTPACLYYEWSWCPESVS
ncbi:hypothetical protein MtrunA17_Chr5g0397461 [Medicago truncatula]|uniref:Uncharacterized protein n=1 Tax=Medicago truncatula TaxID=3880 RepID=A0A396HJX6_MEDTR|nr:hypothetical protein MtrunA17_Chr5g0397461 [Medicago truncatula]